MGYYGGGSSAVVMMGGIRRGVGRGAAGGIGGGNKPDPNDEPSWWIWAVIFGLGLLALIFLSCYNF